MSTLFSVFLDRLAERTAALLAGLVSTRIESFHAEVQADQQSRLEDLAHKYELDGKTEVAAILRQRSAQMTSTNLMAEAMQVLDQVARESSVPTGFAKLQSQSDLRSLPDIAAFPENVGRNRRRAVSSPSSFDTSPAPTDNQGVVS